MLLADQRVEHANPDDLLVANRLAKPRPPAA
jgi:hypothetical protein